MISEKIITAIKSRVTEVGRKNVSRDLGISYQHLTNKLNGISPITSDDMINIMRSINKIKEAKNAADSKE